MKNWFLERFLPMWAKQTVLADNRRLSRQVQELQMENRQLAAYIRGLRKGLRSAPKKENVS